MSRFPELFVQLSYCLILLSNFSSSFSTMFFQFSYFIIILLNKILPFLLIITKLDEIFLPCFFISL